VKKTSGAAASSRRAGVFAKKGGAKKAGAKKKAPRAPSPSAPKKFTAPSDFRNAVIDLKFATGADGLIVPTFQVERVKGRKWEDPETKRFNMMEYDATTVVGMFARMSAMCFAANIEKRLPAKARFRVILRVGKRKADDSLMVRCIAAARLGKSAKTGKAKWFWFSMDKNHEKTVTVTLESGKKKQEKRMIVDPVYTKLRRSVKHLAGAFINIQLPPSGRRPKKQEEADE
jgi:hypothetical protein